MESCLLCLATEKNVVGRIKVNSAQWKTENVEYLIEKHLWSINPINDSDWVCIICCDFLKSFHKFYLRIKEAREIFILTPTLKNENTQNDDIKTSNGHKKNFEPEILIAHPNSKEYVSENENPLVKEECVETILDDEPSKQVRKRGRPPKKNICDSKHYMKDPLKNANNKPKPLIKNKKIKSTSSLKSPSFAVKNNEKTNTEEIVVTSSTSLDANDNLASETEYENDDDKTLSESCKKKRKNPDEQTRKEYDKIIEEYFKIYCSFCQIHIENFIALRKHFREEHKKRGFVVCCKKKIFTRPILVDHIRFHLDPNFFKCKQCDKVYSDRCTLESHVKIHEFGQQDRNYGCDTCGKSFVGTVQLETHKLTHAPDYEKKYSCSECGKFFTTLYSLNYHIQAIHHNKYVKICDICGKTMRCRNSFKLHMEKHANKIATPIHCEICGLRLIDRRGLRRHKNSQHPIGGKKEYSCHTCSKISPNLRALRTHIRFAHETGYIHKCTMCDKAFKRPEALKEHMATHTGTPLYSCPWCPKTFISNGNMHNHRKKSHPKEWENAQREKYGGIIPSNFKAIITPNSSPNKTL